jgi:hypothetical protein
VNKPANGVRRHHSDGPQQHQQNGNSPQHVTPPLRFKNVDFLGHHSTAVRGVSKIRSTVDEARLVPRGWRLEQESRYLPK